MALNESPTEVESRVNVLETQFYPRRGNGMGNDQYSVGRTVVSAVFMTLLPVSVVFVISFPVLAILVLTLAVSVALGRKLLGQGSAVHTGKANSGPEKQFQPVND